MSAKGDCWDRCPKQILFDNLKRGRTGYGLYLSRKTAKSDALLRSGTIYNS